MKKHNKFPMRNDHSILLSEELRRVWVSLREAESFVDSEMAMQELQRIVKRLENQSGA